MIVCQISRKNLYPVQVRHVLVSQMQDYGEMRKLMGLIIKNQEINQKIGSVKISV